ncbi:unnamed protein product [Notodromas monacha]|uniref:Uncharacterized protein n=1 Tax=Notodromas monacha TaxID=399045 RepID=A0A7R9BLL7_9CRUS|nr:unnamed protein product [Notodromas monacha]CAG0916901.1 unnamed protein product [Notodromas monacha]
MPPKKKKKKGKKGKKKGFEPYQKDYAAMLGGVLYALYTLLQWVRCAPKKEGPQKGHGFAPLAHWRLMPYFICSIMSALITAASKGFVGKPDWPPPLYTFRSLASGAGLMLVCTQFMFYFGHSTKLIQGYTTLVWLPLAASLSWVDRYSKSCLYIGDAFGAFALGYLMLYGAMARRNRDLLFACILFPMCQYLIGKDGFQFLNFFYYYGMLYAQKFLTNAIITAQGRRPPGWPI